GCLRRRRLPPLCVPLGGPGGASCRDATGREARGAADFRYVLVEPAVRRRARTETVGCARVPAWPPGGHRCRTHARAARRPGTPLFPVLPLPVPPSAAPTRARLRVTRAPRP